MDRKILNIVRRALVKESKNMCEECGVGNMYEGECMECGYTKENVMEGGMCSECGEGYGNEEEWLYNTECEICGHPIPQHLIVKRP
jgi:hypothetical protein